MSLRKQPIPRNYAWKPRHHWYESGDLQLAALIAITALAAIGVVIVITSH